MMLKDFRESKKYPGLLLGQHLGIIKIDSFKREPSFNTISCDCRKRVVGGKQNNEKISMLYIIPDALKVF